MGKIILNGPLTKEKIRNLKSGDEILYTGEMYTGRDAAHKRIVEAIELNEKIPFEIENALIYYVGPCPAKEGKVIGSAGPTTSLRMDPYTKPLLERGLLGMIGKGKRSEAVRQAIKSTKSIYFLTIGGAGALLAKAIKKAEVIAYDDLGAEAVRRLYVEDFPMIVGIDSKGEDLFNRLIVGDKNGNQ
jgi:fumarate hydratase subunit beta